MDTLQIIVLAIVQGVTEFLPISSSGHLILLPQVTGWPDQGLAFDVAAHFGSLVAVVVYFRQDLLTLACAWARSVAGGDGGPEARLAWGVLLGTVPVGVIGLLAHDAIASHLRVPLVIAATTVVFGLALAWSDVSGRRARELATLRFRDVAFIGFAQALALIPGTSRSGITMTAALAAGFTRAAAARFSFLLSVPVIVLASVLEIVELSGQDTAQPWADLVLVAGFAGASAFVCIHAFLRFIESIGMMPFVVYRLVLGALLFWYFL